MDVARIKVIQSYRFKRLIGSCVQDVFFWHFSEQMKFNLSFWDYLLTWMIIQTIKTIFQVTTYIIFKFFESINQVEAILTSEILLSKVVNYPRHDVFSYPYCKSFEIYFGQQYLNFKIFWCPNCNPAWRFEIQNFSKFPKT